MLDLATACVINCCKAVICCEAKGVADSCVIGTVSNGFIFKAWRLLRAPNETFDEEDKFNWFTIGSVVVVFCEDDDDLLSVAMVMGSELTLDVTAVDATPVDVINEVPAFSVNVDGSTWFSATAGCSWFIFFTDEPTGWSAFAFTVITIGTNRNMVSIKLLSSPVNEITLQLSELALPIPNITFDASSLS